MIDWNKTMFKIELEAITKNGLSDKIVDVIKSVGQPYDIKYGKRKGDLTVWETATLFYEKEKGNVDKVQVLGPNIDNIQTIGPNLDDVPMNCFK